MPLKARLKEIFFALQEQDFSNIDEEVEYFFGVLAEQHLRLVDELDPTPTNTALRPVPKPQIFQKLSHLLQDCKEDKKSSQDILLELENLYYAREEKQTDLLLGQDYFISTIKEIQEILDTCSEEILQFHEICQQLLSRNKSLVEQENQAEFLHVVHHFYQNLSLFDQFFYNKEVHISSLHERLHRTEKMLKQMEQKIRMDTLTRIYRRSYLEQLLCYCESRFKDYGENYSILFFDIDGFKFINDAYGHSAGDALLVQFARVLKSNSRTSDMVGRYGGDEFLILMPKASVSIAKEVALRICKVVAGQEFLCQDVKITVSTSIGVVDRLGFASKEQMLHRVDSLLYEAKKNGRNQVRWE
ncbi:GGDEF domain-containing protein [Helicobacter mustelae]|uniref:diguanylate cyclase n=1 Tax=Helicobacter mustelae (strain ATCC 43772 / CCUG 25715 / CIP 103759 / LMG 18044 / NCTC 12198 / R85-136P) TaxID=679897 RepID=D3UID7_HELM1|nr:GGDEF domain-containing protein [Helicobacter mustelae]CBG40260.1 putative GGDEF domain protein [Helicobacter mustelae 12198]SQH71759.1 GGDEF domain-containing protein [Helicobacter mustelae]STP12888.1 GGDEF domain-containing protein [Helicobacter mustelae]